jgi:hypothetical protein
VNTLLSENFESGLGNWTSWGDNNTWEITTATAKSPVSSLTDSSSGNYLDNTDSHITYNTPLNVVDKIASMDIQLQCELEDPADFLAIGGDLGGGIFLPVYLLNGQGWFSGSTGGLWNLYTTDLSRLGDFSNAINIGFNLYSDSSTTFDGVYIDDVVVTARDILVTGYNYVLFHGTSMAAPHVSGLAGLILARYPGITLNELKDRILNGVDTVASLNGKVLTNGRIDAYKSLALPVGPTNLTATKASSTQIDLSWSDNSDPAFNENGFRIERRTGTLGSYVEIDTVGQDEATYQDIITIPAMTEFSNRPSQEETYYYRVRAYNSSGNSSFSNEANETIGESPLIGGGGSSGGCFIATAAFGSPLDTHVKALRDVRDRYLLTNSIGKASVFLYYTLSPPIADFISKNKVLRAATRVSLYPVAGLRYMALHFSHTGNIMLLLGIVGMLGIVAGLFFRVSKVNRKKI